MRSWWGAGSRGTHDRELGCGRFKLGRGYRHLADALHIWSHLKDRDKGDPGPSGLRL